MPTPKPLEALSPAYRKRIESAIRRGLLKDATSRRDVARGHTNINLGRLSASTIRESQNPLKHPLLQAVLRDGSQETKILYGRAKKEGFKERAPFSSGPPTEKEKLLNWLYGRGRDELEDSEFSSGPGEAFTNVTDLDTFVGILSDIEKRRGEGEYSKEQIREAKENLAKQRAHLIDINRLTPARWGKKDAKKDAKKPKKAAKKAKPTSKPKRKR